MIEDLALALGFLLTAAGLAAWAIALFRAAAHRDPFRGVKGGNGRLPASHRYERGD